MREYKSPNNVKLVTPTYHYQVREIEEPELEHPGGHALQRTLNQLGIEGWEAVWFHREAGVTTVVFERLVGSATN